MAHLKFRLTLESALRFSKERSNRDENGRIYISGTMLKGAIRNSLYHLVVAGKAHHSIEDKLLGAITNEVAKAAAISISPALTEDAIEVETRVMAPFDKLTRTTNPGKLFFFEVIPKGTVFKGIVRSRIPENTPEDMALRLAMLSVRNVGADTSRGYGACKVELCEDNTKTELLYDIDAAKASNHLIKRAKLWIPDLENELICYFARNPEEMRLLSPRSFEELVAALFRREGFSVQLTPQSRDGGYDILAVRHNKLTGNETFLVECKRYAEQKRVGIAIIRNLMGVLQFENATKGIIATTGFFSSEARRKAETISTRLVLHDYDFLKGWLNQMSGT